MNVIANLAPRSVQLGGPLMCRDKADVQAIRADGDVWPADLNYRLAVYDKSQLLAFVALTRDALGRTLYGTLNTNTTEAIAAFSNVGDRREIPVTAVLLDVDGSGVVRRIFGQSDAMMLLSSWDAGETVLTADSLLYGSEAIGAADESIVVAFGQTFAAAPVVTATVECPANGAIITATVTATVSGFTATLSAAPGASGYKLNWIAAKL